MCDVRGVPPITRSVALLFPVGGQRVNDPGEPFCTVAAGHTCSYNTNVNPEKKWKRLLWLGTTS